MTTPVVGAGEPGVLEAAVSVLSRGGLVVLPTDTVYGVAASAVTPGATAGIFAAKARPPDQALAVLVADGEQAATVADLGAARHPDELARLLSDAWPGRLTVVVPRRATGVSIELGGDPSTVGVRCPDHDLVRTICSRVGPLATTSANRHGAETPVEAAAASAGLAQPPDLVIDGGRCDGEASTVVDATREGWPVLRRGSFDVERVLSFLR